MFLLCYLYNMRRTTGQAALTLLCVAVAAGWLSVALRAQTAFDVASVKENSSGGLDGVFRREPGRFTVTNLSLEWIIQTAYGIRDYQLVNAPNWTKRRYDIAATFAPPDASQDEVRPMLQRLLANRFGLRVHREERRLPKVHDRLFHQGAAFDDAAGARAGTGDGRPSRRSQ
jgi:hypothetical protein